MKSAVAVGVISVSMVGTCKIASAADSQKHYYGSLFGGLATGIPVETAVMMALGNEMIDRGLWTTPMGLPTPRLLFHFMGTPVDFTVDEGAGKRLLAIASIKHPLFYNLLDQGIRTKNPVFIGAALHLLIDTFYHAGYSNLLGHVEGGHRPDMPYTEVHKARQCFQAMIEVLFILRDMTTDHPDLEIMKRIVADVSKEPTYRKALEKETGGKSVDDFVKVASRRPDIFTLILLDHDLVRNSLFTNVEKSAEYTKIMIPELVKIFNKQGYSSLSPQEIDNVSAEFSDVAARTDLDPLQTMKIIMYRILQVQDPILQRLSNPEIGLNSTKPSEADLKAKVVNAKVDFSRLAGFSNRRAFLTNIGIEAKKNAAAFGFLLANVKIFRNRIEKTDATGKRYFIRSHDWDQATQTMAENLFPEVLSWLHLFNPTDGSLRTVEHRDLGHLVSTQYDIDWMRNLIDMNADNFNGIEQIFRRVHADPRVLQIASRLKALAESAYHLANNQTKDIIPNKLSPIQHVNYENDSLPHACFARDCRMDAMKNLIAEMANIKVEAEPMSIIAFIRSKVAKITKLIKEKLLFKKIEADIVAQDQYVREYVHGLGYGTKDASGRIILPEDRADLFKVSPNLSVPGYLRWTASTWKYVFRVISKFTKAKNAQIEAYIRQGEIMKTHVINALDQAYYSDKATGILPIPWTMTYGSLNVAKTPAEWGVTGVTPTSSTGQTMTCQSIFKPR
jgi:hypothetical protein